ncbi:hypothetical protein [Pseudomonas sp.]|uniref:hypothetical protein n=1 Tax=Pseudomonas sp. TaxID=306 RepID=UPI003CC54F46
MQRLPLALLIALVAGCAQHAPAPEPAKPHVPSDAEKMLSDTLALPPVPESVMRNGDTLSYLAVPPVTEQQPYPFAAQIEASCASHEASIAYLQGEKRVYFGSTNGTYMPPRNVPDELVHTLKDNAAFKAACQATAAPEWRVVKGGNDVFWVLLDRNSIKADGNEVRFWAALDEPTVTLGRPYHAPSAQKREHYAVDCSKQTFRLLMGYDVDERNRVTDGKLFNDPQPQPVSRSVPEYQTLFASVCGKPEALAQLPAYTARSKAPIDTPLPAVGAVPMTALKHLNLAPPAKRFKQTLETGTANTSKSNLPIREERFFEVDKASGQLGIRLRADTYEGNEVSFRGLVSLAQKTRFFGKTVMTEESMLTNLTFTGDWQQMPVGTELTYTTQGKRKNSMMGDLGESRQVVKCRVESEASAAQINASLSGQAKELRCSGDGDPLKRVDTVWYLEDYGYFFKQGTDKNALYYDERTLKRVQ